MAKDVMVFYPVYWMVPEAVQAILELEWGGPLTILCQRDNPTGDKFVDVVNQYQRGRETFLQGRYEAMLVIESDNVPPKDALKRLNKLLEQGADIAYGVYVYRGVGVVNILEKYYTGTTKKAKNIGESLTLRGLYQSACEQGVIECSGSGFGCTLISRKVLEAIPFDAPAEPGYPDWLWTERAYQAGYKMMADMGVKVGHKVDGKMLRPE